MTEVKVNYATIDITSKCNLNCKYCHNKSKYNNIIKFIEINKEIDQK